MEDVKVIEMILYRNLHRTEHNTTQSTDNMRIRFPTSSSFCLSFFFFFFPPLLLWPGCVLCYSHIYSSVAVND